MYLIGSGIASLASAVYLEKDAGVPGENIIILEKEQIPGCALDETGGLVTLTDSNWLMSIVIARQPHFPNQPDNIKIFRGYGLYPDRKGNYINKTMAECTGAEILEELYYHLKIQDLMKPVTDAGKANCIPVAMPFVDSLLKHN